MSQIASAYQAGPVRQLTTTSPHRTVGGIFISGITPYPAEYESYNEKHAILSLALCHDVLEIKSQPVKTHYPKNNGKSGYHIPDLEVIMLTGESLLLEVKAIENLLEIGNIAKYREIAQYYYHERRLYRFLSNVQLEVKPRFETVLLLQRYLTNEPDISKVTIAYEALAGQVMQIDELMVTAQLNLAEIYAMISKRLLCINWCQPLTHQSCVSMPNQPFRGLSLEDILNSTRFCCLLEGLAMGREPTDQQLMAAAKNWRRSNNLPQLWGMVGGFVPATPINHIEKSGFLRSPHHRRSYAPGCNDQAGGEL